MATCDCRDTINAKLAEHNTRIKHYYTLSGNGLGMPWPVETEQVEKGRGKKKAMSLFASFCPFCGASLRAKDEAARCNGGAA